MQGSAAEGVPPSPEKLSQQTASGSKAWDQHWAGASPAGVTVAVHARYGGDNYGTLASKRSYIEIDYLREESERKRARLLVVPTRPSVGALLLQRDDDRKLQHSLLLEHAQPEGAVLPSTRPGSDCAAAAARTDADTYLRQKAVLAPFPRRSKSDRAGGTHAPGLQLHLDCKLQLRQQRCKTLEFPQVLSIGELIGQLDADEEERLVALPVPDLSTPHSTAHTLMISALDKVTNCSKVTPVAELSSAHLNMDVHTSVQPLEIPAMLGIDVKFWSASDALDLQEIPRITAPETAAVAGTHSCVSLAKQQIQKDLGSVVTPKSKLNNPKASGLDVAELASTLTKHIPPLELPYVPEVVRDLHLEQFANMHANSMESLVPGKRIVSAAPSLHDMLRALCTADVKEVLARSMNRLCLQPLRLPVLACPLIDEAGDFLTRASSLLPCSTSSLELNLKQYRADAVPYDLASEYVAKDLHDLTKTACRLSEGADQACGLSTLLYAPVSAASTARESDDAFSTITDSVQSESGTLQDKHAVHDGDIQEQPTKAAIGDKPSVRPHDNFPKLETPMPARVQRAKCKQQHMHQSNIEAHNLSPLAAVQPGEEAAHPSQTCTVQDITRWRKETTLIPADLQSKLIHSSDARSGWKHFQSAFDFSNCDTRGSYFKYCSMVDDLLEEAAEERPRLEALLKQNCDGASCVVDLVTAASNHTSQSPSSFKTRCLVGMKDNTTNQRRSSGSSEQRTAANDTRLPQRQQLKQHAAGRAPSTLEEFIAEATEVRTTSKQSLAAPEGVPVCKEQISFSSMISDGKSSVVLLPHLVEKALHAVCVYSFVASREDRAVLWLSEDADALAELHAMLQSFCEISAAANQDLQCQLLSHHEDVRGALKDCGIVMMAPSVLDRAMRHDASLSRLLANSTDVLVLHGFTTAHTVATKLMRTFAPWLAEPQTKGKSAVVFAAGSLPQSADEFVTVLQKIRLDRIICRLSTDVDIAAFSSLKNAASRIVRCHPSTCTLETIKTRIRTLTGKLSLSDGQEATLSRQSLVLLANEAGQKIRTAHSIGDNQAKGSWSEKYRLLVQTLVCLEAFETMADKNVDEGMRVLGAALSDVQGKARILKGSLNGLYAELQRSVAGSTSASSVTKLATLQAVLTEYLQTSRLNKIEASVGLSQPAYKVLVLVVDDTVAAHVVDAVQLTYPTRLLDGTFSDYANAAASDDAQVYVATVSDCLEPSISAELLQCFSLVITMCESIGVRFDPILQQHVQAQRLRHVAILIESPDLVQRCSLDEPSRLDSFVSAARASRDLETHSMNIIGVDRELCKQLCNSTEVAASLSNAAMESGRCTASQTQQQIHQNTEQEQPQQQTIIVSNNVLRRNDILNYLETNAIKVIERESSMTKMDIIITPEAGCVMLALANVEMCSTGQQPSQAAQSYMKGLSERLLQGRNGFRSIEIVVEHGVAGSSVPTAKGVQRLMKFLNELKTKPINANITSAECKFNIHHSIGDPQTATAQKLLWLVKKHHPKAASSTANTDTTGYQVAMHSSCAVVSEQASVDEVVLVRSAAGAINPMVAQTLMRHHSLASIATMGTQYLQERLWQTGVKVPLAAVEQIQARLLSSKVANDKPGPKFLGRKQRGCS